MQFVTITDLRNHCRADSDDDGLLTLYADAAEQTVQKLADRAIYATADAHAAAVDLLPAQVAAAKSAYTAALDAAALLADDTERAFAEETALDALNRVLNESHFVRDGIVVTSDMKAAILLIVGSLYRNREEVVVGSAQALQIPMGAHAIMAKYRKVTV